MSALSLACSLQDNSDQRVQLNEQLLNIIMECKPDVNHKDEHHRTPLHFACTIGNKTAVKVLIENNADLNAQTIVSKKLDDNLLQGGDTPLMKAASQGQIEICTILLKEKCDPRL